MLQLETVWSGSLFTTAQNMLDLQQRKRTAQPTIPLKVSGTRLTKVFWLICVRDAGGWKRDFFLPPPSSARPLKTAHLSQNNLPYRPFSFHQADDLRPRSIDGNGTPFFSLELHNYRARQDRAVGRGAQCHSGEPHLIKHWEKKDNYNFSGGRETSPMFHVPYLNWKLTQVTGTSASGAGPAPANPQSPRPQDHSLLGQDPTWSFGTKWTTVEGDLQCVSCLTLLKFTKWVKFLEYVGFFWGDWG